MFDYDEHTELNNNYSLLSLVSSFQTKEKVQYKERKSTQMTEKIHKSGFSTMISYR